VHAVELLNHLAGERDTDVDERRVIERRVRRRPGAPDSDERSEVSEPPSFKEAGGELESVAAARLDEVRLKETIARRTAPGPGSADHCFAVWRRPALL